MSPGAADQLVKADQDAEDGAGDEDEGGNIPDAIHAGIIRMAPDGSAKAASIINGGAPDAAADGCRGPTELSDDAILPVFCPTGQKYFLINRIIPTPGRRLVRKNRPGRIEVPLRRPLPPDQVKL